ncbi:DUF2975 domain-containing protein [Flavobacterium urocaniciphilum]|uniref:DUF2975 domain-containing protein n=1 Tax=Flavobacterium urocaniciphilum TaxID=1299341 RepID=A0A1H8YW88_9FLAO|nr:DUF2975 domain-containing protein [Flavobacterium urocaniciphilum]SEP56386.1 Protein of unknown function [Flavobacterium urocaniciphilum]
MEIKISSKQTLMVLRILCWLIFIGLCIESGGILFNIFYTLLYNPIGAGFFWNQIDFSSLYQYDRGHFIVVTVIMLIVALLKALMFYLIIRIIENKKLSINSPFNHSVRKCILIEAFISFGIGFFSNYGMNYTEWLANQNIKMPSFHILKIAGGDVWLFMGMILLVIAFIFKRGIELQEEIDLTV